MHELDSDAKGLVNFREFMM